MWTTFSVCDTRAAEKNTGLGLLGKTKTAEPKPPKMTTDKESVRLAEAVAAADEVKPAPRRRRRRKGRRRLRGADGEPLPQYLIDDHPGCEYMFQMGEVQYQKTAESMLEDLEAGRVPKHQRSGMKLVKRRFQPPPACAYPDRRPVPPREPPRGARRVALQVDEILHVGTSNPIPMMIDRIEAMRGYQ